VLIQKRISSITEPCFLVATRLSNVPFYERFGFERQHELALDNGALRYPMLRTG
jgi:predicted N-acetyltransferase YhbS